MTNDTRKLVTPVLVLALGITTSGSAQLPTLDQLMREKLEHSKYLLEAVVLADHTSVERLANELVLLSEATTWSPLQTPEYLHYASDFREAAQQLIREAGERNTDGVSLAYMEMILTCVQCHKHVRGAAAAN